MRSFWGADDAMVVIDEMHSASRGYLRAVCDKLGIRYTVMHGEKNPLLGELMYANPEPPHIGRCQEKVRELREQYPRIIGVGMDTDSDRFGVVDEQGNYVMTNQLLPMLADYLLTAAYNGKPGKIIRNMVTTRLLDRIAAAHREPDHPPAGPGCHRHARRGIQLPGGAGRCEDAERISHLGGAGRLQIHRRCDDGRVARGAWQGAERDPERIQQVFHECLQRLLIAGEESNGMTSRGHTPDKDGLWGALLTLQMCAVREQDAGCASGSMSSPTMASWSPSAAMSRRRMSPRKRW